MSNVSSSPTSVVAYGSQSATGGTCFLDLPLELRTMIYDLTIPQRFFKLIPSLGQPKPGVAGINLLQSCKQIRHETHNRIWCGGWSLDFTLGASSADLGVAASSLHGLALAKIRVLSLQIRLNPDDVSSWGPIDLKVLKTFKSLRGLSLTVYLGTPDKYLKFRQSEDLSKSVFLTGLVTQVLPQIPANVFTLIWGLYIWESEGQRHSGALDSIAKKYKHLQGSDCLPKASNSSDIPALL